MSRTYDPGQVNVVLGISAINNWDTVRVALEEDQVMHSAGTQGEVTRTLNSNRLGTIVITLPQTSIDNETLSTYAVSKIVVPCSIIDNNGTTKAIIPLGTVIKQADTEMGKESGQREWTIRGKLDIFYVGSNTLDTAVDMGS